MSSQTPAGAEHPPLRPLFPTEAGRAYSLDLLKAYSELRERPDAAGRSEPPAPAEVRPADPTPPPVTADSSGSPPKPAASKDDSKAASCDSTEQLSERCSPPLPAAKLLCDAAGGGVSGGGQDPGIRRYRTAFRPDQIKRLETEFIKDNYVSRPKRNELANELGLAEGTIKVWFQNRRMKHKRQQMTTWPLDPRFTDPALAALILQAAVASGGYPYGGVGGLAVTAPPPLPYYSPLAASKCRFSPYPALPVRPQPSLASSFLLPPLDGCRPPPPPLHATLLPPRGAPLSPPSALSPAAPPSLAVATSSEQSSFFRPFKPDSPPSGGR